MYQLFISSQIKWGYTFLGEGEDSEELGKCVVKMNIFAMVGAVLWY
jgi:hypothetical protein